MSYLPSDFPDDPAVPSPASILEVEIGSRPLNHHEILTYADRLASMSGRVALTEYGRTFEDRPLVHMTVGSEANIIRLNEITEATRRLGEPSSSGDSAGVDLPASIWIGCSIHGDELSGADAGIALAHRLASGTDELSARIRDRLLVHIDPTVNPDGRERALAEVTSWKGRIPDLEAGGITHRLRWPRGRGNHYLFDLNRDLVPQIHPETRARTGAFLRLMPQLVIELHEMGHDDTFLFASPGIPLNPYLPAHAAAWWDRLSHRAAAELASFGQSSYRGEWNEVFYPGYMDIWPAYHGAVPVIFEQPHTLGSPVRQRTGRILTFADAVRNHVASLLAYLDVASDDAPRLLDDWATARRRASEQRAGRTELAYRLSSIDPSRVRWVVDALLSQGVKVDADSSQGDVYVVRLDQPAAPLVRNLLDDEVPLPKDFLDQARATIDATGDGVLYDVTAWSLALAAGVSADAVATLPAGSWEQLHGLPEVVAGVQRPGEFGFLFIDGRFRLTAPLLGLGARLHVARDPFVHGQTNWPRGTILLTRGENPEAISSRLDALARDAEVSVNGVDGPLSESGPDLGGHRFPLIVPPRVGAICGDGIEATSFGAIWHALDMAGTSTSGLDVGQFGSAEIAGYNVLIFPETDDSDGHGLLHTSLRDRVHAWVATGGTLIGVAGGARVIAQALLGHSAASFRSEDATKRYMPHGAFVWADMSSHHWLTVGSDARIAVLHRSYGVMETGATVEVAARFAGPSQLHASGLVWSEAREQIGGTPWMTRESVGRGQIVLFATDPIFRGFTLATARLLMNAIHFGPGLGTGASGPWR